MITKLDPTSFEEDKEAEFFKQNINLKGDETPAQLQSMITQEPITEPIPTYCQLETMYKMIRAGIETFPEDQEIKEVYFSFCMENPLFDYVLFDWQDESGMIKKETK